MNRRKGDSQTSKSTAAPCDLSRGRDLSIQPRRKVKEPGKNPMPGLKMTFPKLIGCLDYLFVEVDGGALVGAGVLVSLLSLQPVTTPITKPNSTIRVHSLFIVGVTLTNSEKRTSKNFA
jgi:hypothetical protein